MTISSLPQLKAMPISYPIPANRDKYHSLQMKDRHSKMNLSHFQRARRRFMKQRKELFTIVPTPAPRLVGIETNPGPRSRASRGIASSGANVARSIANDLSADLRSRSLPNSAALRAIAQGRPRTRSNSTPAARRTAPPRRRRRRVGSTSSMLEKYKRSLLNPFDCPPPCILAGNFLPLAHKSIYLKYILNTTEGVDATDNYLIVTHPSSLTIMGIWAVNGNGTPFSTGSYLQTASTNGARVAQEIQSARCISGGVCVSNVTQLGGFAPTCLSGVLWDSPSVLIGQTADFIQNLPSTKMISSPTDARGAYSTYRPVDATSFELGNRFTWNLTDNNGYDCFQYILIKASSGYNFRANIDVIYHLEVMAGAEAFAEDDAGDVENLSSALSASEAELGRVAASLPAPVGSSDAIEHLVIASINDAAARNITSLRMEGGHVGTVSSSLAPVKSAASPVGDGYIKVCESCKHDSKSQE